MERVEIPIDIILTFPGEDTIPLRYVDPEEPYDSYNQASAIKNDILGALDIQMRANIVGFERVNLIGRAKIESWELIDGVLQILVPNAVNFINTCMFVRNFEPLYESIADAIDDIFSEDDYSAEVTFYPRAENSLYPADTWETRTYRFTPHSRAARRTHKAAIQNNSKSLNQAATNDGNQEKGKRIFGRKNLILGSITVVVAVLILLLGQMFNFSGNKPPPSIDCPAPVKIENNISIAGGSAANTTAPPLSPLSAEEPSTDEYDVRVFKGGRENQ